MDSFTHRGTGRLTTPLGPADVTYVLTVTRSQTALDGYGHVQSKAVAFAELLLAGKPLELQLEPGGSVQIVLTTAAGERAIFGTSGSLPDWLFR
jgi:hypothetical protein